MVRSQVLIMTLIPSCQILKLTACNVFMFARLLTKVYECTPHRTPHPSPNHMITSTPTFHRTLFSLLFYIPFVLSISCTLKTPFFSPFVGFAAWIQLRACLRTFSCTHTVYTRQSRPPVSGSRGPGALDRHLKFLNSPIVSPP